MSKILLKNKKFELNKVCRTCLTARGHLREIFSTRLPMMMETCASMQVNEDDGLPKQICVSCFHQIAKFYTFKKKMERSDRILRNYVKQMKLQTKNFSDILHRAVNDAQIDSTNTNSNDEDVKEESDDDIPLIKRQKEISSPRLGRRSKQKASRIIDYIIKEEEDIDIDELNEFTNVSNYDPFIDSTIFSNGPPPLVPLAAPKPTVDVTSNTSNVILKELPKNAPPLVPIKPLSTLSPVTIINTIYKGIEEVPLQLQCHNCSEEFTSVQALKQHRLTSCQTTGLQCNICRKEFKERKKLIGHLKGHMVTKDYGCKICGKRYPNPSTFRVHMRTHTGERPYKCQVCGKGFIRWAGVMGHMKTHESIKPFKCQTCGKGFKISSNLERHKVLHSGILPYCCSYCGKTFSQSDNLQLHIRTYHTHERPYLCNECGKGFVSSTRLNRHMWVHTGYKPYRCKHCPKAYSNSNDLKNHERTHSGGYNDADKPHVCPTCEMRFFHPCRLAKHMKTHDRPFACTECAKTFSTEGILQKHFTSKHGVQYVEELEMPPLSVNEVNEVYIQFE